MTKNVFPPKSVLPRLVLLFLLACRTHAPEPRLQVPMVTDEAQAVLVLLDRVADGEAPGDAEWQRLFATEGYRRLKQREHSLSRPFEDSAFRAFLRSDTLLARADALRRTLAAWTRVDPGAAARHAFAYLPREAVIHAKVYPVIKPKTNSFVFESRTNPAIFLYLDPAVSPAKLDNILIHELHHIGVGSVCPAEVQDSTLSQPVRTALAWMGGFAEGRAVLTAAGKPEIHPHATSDSAERAIWDRDLAHAARDMRRLEEFFLALLDDRLSEDEQARRGMSFIATEEIPQGAYYTVGWLMASTVERRLGRQRLVATLCDPVGFLGDYNSAAMQGRTGAVRLPLWSDTLMARLRTAR
ncbi:MAG: hypothetical protein NUW01_01540 [Gemmatimonadaceae bacterium]|nr:hypothetical protein [Gemmatimonadaceae bacterium]